MFGTYEKYNLVRANYCRHASNTYIFEDYHKSGQLRLSNNWTGMSLMMTDFAFDIKLLVNGLPVKYSYFADEGSVKLTAKNGAEAEIALTSRKHFRMRGRNAGIRLELRSASGNGAAACRGVYMKPDGTGCESDYGRFGKLYMKALKGGFSETSVFDDEQNKYTLVRFDFIPDAADNEFDAAVHDYDIDLYPFGGYECFDEVVEGSKADFAAFRSIYKDPAPEFEELMKYAVWTVWSHRTKAIGQMKDPVILYLNTWSSNAMPWQQSYNAMSMLNDAKEAWRMICVYFNYQDERTGRLPGGMSYIAPPMSGFQPAFQGFAVDFLRQNFGDEFVTAEEASKMLPKFERWVNYWTTYRSAGRGDDVTAVESTHESGWDDASIFKDGFPCSDPCTIAFLILMMEQVAWLAGLAGNSIKQEEYSSRSKRLLDTLITEFWDGEKFISRVNGKAVDSMSLANYQPIMLGRRLPQEIIDKCAEKLTEENQWLTEIGLASENVNSPIAHYGIGFVSGRVIGPQNMIITVGLRSSGKLEAADMIARRFCAHADREGVILGYAPYNYMPATGEAAAQQVPPTPADGWPWSSWTANSIITMLTGVMLK